ncbi:MAG: PP2C family protein-serine/threonine phosphatase [Terracidiphilus sp.]|jgi:hypothetical protein
MAGRHESWRQARADHWNQFRAVPLKRLWVFMAAVFFLFSIIGPFSDMFLDNGVMPYAVVLALAFCCGVNVVLWVLVLARLPKAFLFILIVMQFFISNIFAALANWMIRTFNLQAVAPQAGVHFASIETMAAVALSYGFFVAYIRREGVETFRLENELKLAHGIQKTLVPPIALHSSCFDVYGISYPSEKVGGDLVDALHLPNGDAIAYLADIAGHGLQAGILMGMLKTAVRTALLDAGERSPERTLPVLLDRLNTVLPEVKEPQMYATFTGFRLGCDGSVYYAIAASPPILQWHAAEQRSSHTDEAQFPLGLVPVPKFDGEALRTEPGDLLVVATDGILEVAGKSGEEYGVERLKDVIAANAKDALPELAGKVLSAVRAFGRQFDDQTILLVRRL